MRIDGWIKFTLVGFLAGVTLVRWLGVMGAPMKQRMIEAPPATGMEVVIALLALIYLVWRAR